MKYSIIGIEIDEHKVCCETCFLYFRSAQVFHLLPWIPSVIILLNAGGSLTLWVGAWQLEHR